MNALKFRHFGFTLLMFISFTVGGICCYYKQFPYYWVRDAVQAANAAITEKKLVSATRRIRADYRQIYTTLYTALPQAYQGYTLATYVGFAGAVLYDMQGQQIYHWQRTENTYHDWSDARVFPNGDLVYVSILPTESPYGAELCKIDKNSKLIWTYNKKTHHNITLTPEGNIVGLSHVLSDTSDFPDLNIDSRKFMEDSVFVLDKDGNELKSVSIPKALEASKYRYLMKRVQKWDFVHPNSAMMLDETMASHFPMFKAGQVLVSLRNIDAIALLDLDKQRFVWLATGPWKGQHDASFQEDGTILFFANKDIDRNVSRILKYNPATKETSVEYEAPNPFSFYSRIRGSVDHLANGNYLVVNSLSGDIFETNAIQRILWRMDISRKGDKRNVVIINAHRYESGYFDSSFPFLSQEDVQ